MEWLLALLGLFLVWALPDVHKKIEAEKAESKHQKIMENFAQKLKSGLEGKSTIQYEGVTELVTINYFESFDVSISKNGELECIHSFKTIYELDNYLTKSTRFRIGDFI